MYSSEYQNHGGLAFIYRNVIKFYQRTLDVDVSTFEYLCGYASTGNSHFLLLGVYRPGSQGLSATFFDDLSAVFERLAVYNCPVVICGDFNVHVDDDNCPYMLRVSVNCCSRSDVYSMSASLLTVRDIHST